MTHTDDELSKLAETLAESTVNQMGLTARHRAIRISQRDLFKLTNMPCTEDDAKRLSHMVKERILAKTSHLVS